MQDISKKSAKKLAFLAQKAYLCSHESTKLRLYMRPSAWFEHSTGRTRPEAMTQVMARARDGYMAFLCVFTKQPTTFNILDYAKD